MGTKKRPLEYEDALLLTQRSKFVYVSSLDEKDFPETRVMFNLRKTCAKALSSGAAALSGDFETFLGTNSSSRKVAQFRVDPKICLYYSDNKAFQGLSLRGTLDEVEELAIKKAVWKPGWEMYYPGGLEGGDFSLLRFTPLLARYYHGLKVVEFGF
jgi:general stress protein 26